MSFHVGLEARVIFFCGHWYTAFWTTQIIINRINGYITAFCFHVFIWIDFAVLRCNKTFCTGDQYFRFQPRVLSSQSRVLSSQSRALSSQSRVLTSQSRVLSCAYLRVLSSWYLLLKYIWSGYYFVFDAASLVWKCKVRAVTLTWKPNCFFRRERFSSTLSIRLYVRNCLGSDIFLIVSIYSWGIGVYIHLTY